MRLALSLIAALSLQSFSLAEGGGGTVEVALQLVDTMDVKTQVKRDFDLTMATITEQLRKLGDADLSKSILEMTEKFYAENYQWERISREYATGYAKEMTDDEMKQAITFYKSEAGKKMLSKAPAVHSAASKANAELLKPKALELQRAMIMAVQQHVNAKGAK